MKQELIFVDNSSAEEYLSNIQRLAGNANKQISIQLRGIGNIREIVESQITSIPNTKIVGSSGIANLVILFEDGPEQLANILHEYIDDESTALIAPITNKYFKNTPLFLISIPKAGTHLLFELAKAFGYTARGTSPEPPKGGEWYYVDNSNAHTRAKHFFVEGVYKGDFGLRDHPFAYSPAIFNYRNPADIVVSEANYYHKKGKTAFYNYFAHDDFNQRLAKLINDPYLLGNIRDRILDFLAWPDFGNVIPASFEELIGSKGGGSDSTQKKLIWSLQLKLQVPGDPEEFGRAIFKEDSDTFFKGQCGGYRDKFDAGHYQAFREQPQDFLQRLGYTIEENDTVFSSRIDEFRQRKLSVDKAEAWPPYIIDNQFLDHRIIRYQDSYYGVPFGENLSNIETKDNIVKGRYFEEVETKLAKKYILDK